MPTLSMFEYGVHISVFLSEKEGSYNLILVMLGEIQIVFVGKFPSIYSVFQIFHSHEIPID